ncbi:Lipase-3 domain-containing protein [Mycena indigotica]|uniref:Lipase-3 domain-containing protein n=1 Tax=Mycena indigotica TaxID=2126181 RepID=A0A8H6SJ17_9AGAR|nr:Lipase-3 domain-containing protein [Mycena indigotica]KAF7298750.1 Lipase-3 domain-containing protein [Mycena indigotica]
MQPLFFSLLLATVVASLSTFSIPQTVFDDLVLYTKYSSAAYMLYCPRPLGNHLIRTFGFFNTHAFIARDDARQELVVVYRGTDSMKDAFTDAEILLLPIEKDLAGVKAHRGFRNAHNSISEDVLATVAAQLQKFPRYSLVVTGHSLGGAVASLAAPFLKRGLNDTLGLKPKIRLFTFGQPRVGNPEFVHYVEEHIGVENIFRAVHRSGMAHFHYSGLQTTFTDYIPKIPRLFVGYQHFATEYWQFETWPPTPDDVTRCVSGEDPSCSASTGSGLPFPDLVSHGLYFGQVMVPPNPGLCIGI